MITINNSHFIHRNTQIYDFIAFNSCATVLHFPLIHLVFICYNIIIAHKTGKELIALFFPWSLFFNDKTTGRAVGIGFFLHKSSGSTHNIPQYLFLKHCLRIGSPLLMTPAFSMSQSIHRIPETSFAALHWMMQQQGEDTIDLVWVYQSLNHSTFHKPLPWPSQHGLAYYFLGHEYQQSLHLLDNVRLSVWLISWQDLLQLLLNFLSSSNPKCPLRWYGIQDD